MQERNTNKQDKLQRWTSEWRLALFVVWTVLGVGALFYFVGGVLGVLSIPIGIVVWTAVFVFTLRGLVNKMDEAGMPRLLAVTIAVLGLIVVVTAVIMLIVRVLNIGDQLMTMVNSFGDYMNSVQAYFTSLEAAYPMIFSDPAFDSAMNSALASLGSLGQSILTSFAESIIEVTAFTINTFMCVLFALVVSFWLLLELPRMGAEVVRLLGPNHSQTIEFFNETFSRVLGGYIKGMVLQCTVIIVGCGICFTIIDVPSGMALAFIVGLCNILPVLGQWIALVIVALLCLFGDPMTAILAIAAAFIVQRVVYTVIYPKIMADSVDVHPVFIIITMMIGYAFGVSLNGLIGGFIGIIVAIPLAAVAKATFVYYFERKTGRHLVAEDGVFFKGTPNEEDEPDPLKNATARAPIRQTAAMKIMERNLKSKRNLVDSDMAKEAAISEDAAVKAVEQAVERACSGIVEEADEVDAVKDTHQMEPCVESSCEVIAEDKKGDILDKSKIN